MNYKNFLKSSLSAFCILLASFSFAGPAPTFPDYVKSNKIGETFIPGKDLKGQLEYDGSVSYLPYSDIIYRVHYGATYLLTTTQDPILAMMELDPNSARFEIWPRDKKGRLVLFFVSEDEIPPPNLKVSDVPNIAAKRNKEFGKNILGLNVIRFRTVQGTTKESNGRIVCNIDVSESLQMVLYGNKGATRESLGYPLISHNKYKYREGTCAQNADFLDSLTR